MASQSKKEMVNASDYLEKKNFGDSARMRSVHAARTGFPHLETNSSRMKISARSACSADNSPKEPSTQHPSLHIANTEEKTCKKASSLLVENKNLLTSCLSSTEILDILDLQTPASMPACYMIIVGVILFTMGYYTSTLVKEYN